MDKLGLIAGNGVFPVDVATCARRRGIRVVAIAHLGETEPALAELCDDLTWIKVGELQRMVDVFKDAGVAQAAFAGGIVRADLTNSFAPDARALRVLAQAGALGDDHVLRAVARDLESEGVQIIDPVPVFMQESLAGAGTLTGPEPSGENLRDVELAFDLMGALGRFDVGQAVAVRDGVVAAIEAVEGTDEAVRRAARLCGKGLVVAKAAKPGQDLRFDRPAIGPATIKLLAEVEAAVVGIQAHQTLILERQRTLDAAAKAGICVYGHA